MPTLHPLGHRLPLPQAVREDDATAPGGSRERPVTREELEEILRESPLCRRSPGLEPVIAVN
ncbi:MAG TPA: hypothetical protein VLF18_18715 [Tahibacter sp.]|uniref:hypothetical protein n=1 Tax=Tahibacter sp. TaxID=2056211 RepID=UPI002C98F047|nr:hypothetical protein [Tahibacter sp.]HSX62221.1 hypothetical protein [Tahibacter sp.]